MSLQAHPTTADRVLGYGISFSHIPEIMLCKDEFRHDEKRMFMGLTVLNVLGYFPLVSTISGIARIIFVFMNKTLERHPSESGKEKAFREAQIVRAGIECLSIAGPLLFIIDTAVTILVINQND